MTNQTAINQINDALIATLEDQIKCQEGYIEDLRGRIIVRDEEIDRLATERAAMLRTMNGAVKEAGVYREKLTTTNDEIERLRGALDELVTKYCDRGDL